MKKIIISILLITFFTIKSNAQTFIDKANIEFEVKTNVKKMMGNGSWMEMWKDMMPQFKAGIYQYSFSGNKGIYKFDRWADGPKMPEFFRKDDEQNVYYTDYDADQMYQLKMIRGSEFYIQDSTRKINWRLTNESRMIAGFNCRKAVGVIMDSIYVFAFYTDEILIPGGPSSIGGLPGMILGLTIPRLYTSYIATKVSVNGVNEAEIKPVAAKKYTTRAALRTLITERAKEWFGEEVDEDSKGWRNNFVWDSLL